MGLRKNIGGIEFDFKAVIIGIVLLVIISAGGPVAYYLSGLGAIASLFFTGFVIPPFVTSYLGRYAKVLSSVVSSLIIDFCLFAGILSVGLYVSAISLTGFVIWDFIYWLFISAVMVISGLVGFYARKMMGRGGRDAIAGTAAAVVEK